MVNYLNTKNNPNYILAAIDLGYDVEIDVWFIDGFLETTPITKEQQVGYMTNNYQHYRIALVNGQPAAHGLAMFQNLSIHNSDQGELNGYRDLTEFTVFKNNKVIE